MTEKIWVIEINLNNPDPFEYRIAALEQTLQMNVTRILCRVNNLSMQWKESNWVIVGMAYSKEEASQKAERLKSMMISEKKHASATGKSLYLNLSLNE